MLFVLEYNYNTGEWLVEEMSDFGYFYIEKIKDWDTRIVLCSY